MHLQMYPILGSWHQPDVKMSSIKKIEEQMISVVVKIHNSKIAVFETFTSALQKQLSRWNSMTRGENAEHSVFYCQCFTTD